MGHRSWEKFYVTGEGNRRLWYPTSIYVHQLMGQLRHL